QRLENRLRNISQAFQEYKQLRLPKNPIKGIYILLFLLMTLIIVFSATWFGLYLARGITEPIQMLAEGTREVAAGNLRYKVEVRADDEIGILVDSFNRMTGDLAASPSKLEETYRARPGGPRHHHQQRGGAFARPRRLPDPRPPGRAGVPLARVHRDRRADPAHGPGARGHARPRGAPAARGPSGGPARLGHRPARARRRLPRHGARVRRPHRAAEGAAPGRVARGRRAARPRDQEPAHPDPALGPA